MYSLYQNAYRGCCTFHWTLYSLWLYESNRILPDCHNLMVYSRFNRLNSLAGEAMWHRKLVNEKCKDGRYFFVTFLVRLDWLADIFSLGVAIVSGWAFFRDCEIWVRCKRFQSRCIFQVEAVFSVLFLAARSSLQRSLFNFNLFSWFSFCCFQFISEVISEVFVYGFCYTICLSCNWQFSGSRITGYNEVI